MNINVFSNQSQENTVIHTQITERIQAHCEMRSSKIHECELSVQVGVVESQHGLTRVPVSISGTINKRPFSMNCRTHRVIANPKYGSGIAFLLRPTVRFLFRSPDDLQQCIDEIVSNLSLAIDEFIGVDQSNARQVYDRFLLFGKILFCWSIIYMFGWCWTNAQKPLTVFHLILLGLPLGAMLGSSLFVIIWLISILILPDSFYLADPKGKQIMAKSGVASPLSLRILAVLFIILILCAVLFTGS